MTKYILGGGIAGLIYAFYNKDYEVISTEFGGQMASYFKLGSRYLHRTDQAINFLKDLNLPVEEIRITTGYQTRTDSYTDIMMDEDFKKRYYMKSRGIKTLEGYDET